MYAIMNIGLLFSRKGGIKDMHDDADVYRSSRRERRKKRQHMSAMKVYMATAVLLAIMSVAAALIQAIV